MASTFAHLELVVLCVLTLTLALLDSPVPRYWAFAAGGLLAAETAAVRLMGLAPFEVESPGRAPGLVGSVAEAIGVIAVPGLTAVLLAVIGFHCARA